MVALHNLASLRVVRALERDGWVVVRRAGSHVHLRKEGNPNVLSIPVHKGKPIKAGTLPKLLKLGGITETEFRALYK